MSISPWQRREKEKEFSLILQFFKKLIERFEWLKSLCFLLLLLRGKHALRHKKIYQSLKNITSEPSRIASFNDCFIVVHHRCHPPLSASHTTHTQLLSSLGFIIVNFLQHPGSEITRHNIF